MNRQLYFVVGDRGLNSGNGVFVQRLEDIKPRLRRHRRSSDWTLVISIHGAQDFIASRVRALRGGRGSYDAAAVRRIFGQDRDFVRWRDQHGPSRLVLNACQVSVELERALIESLTRRGRGARQVAQGLGTGCRPSTDIREYHTRGRHIRTRAQYNRLPLDARTEMLGALRVLNRRWGYFGAPSVPDGMILEHYFNEEPLGAWAIVRVSHNRGDTNIRFHNRTSDPEFRRLCTQGVGTLREHVPGVPPAVRSGQ